jgi:hypothetical protein
MKNPVNTRDYPTTNRDCGGPERSVLVLTVDTNRR